MNRYHHGVLTSRPASHASGPTVTSADFIAKLLHLGEPATASRPALAARCGDRWTELTYAELDRCSAVLAGQLLRAGVTAGDRVVLLAEPSIDWVVAFFGILRAGGIVVPLDARVTPTEVGPLWQRVAPAAAICAPSLRAVLESGTAQRSVPVLVLPGVNVASGDDRPPPIDRSMGSPLVRVVRPATDPALVVFTAGTTAEPKGVTLSFANLAYVVGEAVAAHRPAADDVWLSVLPLSHMLEMSCGLLPALASGGCFSMVATLMPHELAAAIQHRGATRMVAVPLVLRMLQRHPGGHLSPLHTVYCGGAALDPELARSFNARGIAVYQGYGLTEMAPIVCMSTPGRTRAGSVGPPLPGTEVRILGASESGAAGEVLVRGPGLMLGYWGDEALTHSVVDAHGWFHTGDIGHLDSDGFLHLTGRARDLIVLESGKKVQPDEVEAALESSPLVREACVLGMPASRGYGQEVAAVVVVSDDVTVPSDEAARGAAIEAEVALMASTLSRYKRPVRVVVVPGPLPRTPKGSLRRAEVGRQLAETSKGGG